MMAGQSFVISNGLDGIEIAIGCVVEIDHQPSWAAAVGGPRLVIGGRRGLLQVRWDGFDFEGRSGQRAEEFRKLGLHGLQVSAVGGEQRLARRGMKFGICFEAGTEALEILKAELAGYGQHFRFVILYLFEADLVNLRWG